LVLVSVFMMLFFGCGAIERGAARDPRKCELDPNCANKPANVNDCATSCADNIQCMDRCHQVSGQ
jgi:hypothetical protein